ncbi:TPA: hypothetical protein ACVU5P_004239 [Vibrio parahaemolyticus]
MKFKADKCLCAVGAIVMLSTLSIDVYLDRLGIGNAIGLLFSFWLCVGSWHVLDDAENGKSTQILDLYVWPKRYFKK